jgi:hypothetical protein
MLQRERWYQDGSYATRRLAILLALVKGFPFLLYVDMR